MTETFSATAFACVPSLMRMLMPVGLGLSLLSLGGCLPSVSEPPRLYPAQVEAAAIRDQIEMPDFRYYAGLDEVGKQSYRNMIVDARMYAIDLNYYLGEADETHERQAAEFLAAASNIGLTTASVLTPSIHTKDILTGIAGGITGVNAAYGDKVLLNKTIQVLQSQMRAERARVAVKIYASLKLPAAQYGLGMALSDLESYYRAGTITGALIDISNAVGVDAVQAKRAKDAFVVDYGYAVDTTATSLRAFIYPNGKFDQANYKKIAALLPAGVTDPLSRILSMPKFAAVRADLVKQAIAKGYIK
ncbi:hypothetical protein JQ594_00720 [Bradyrhizobium manausense]|uniref:hypothetical protein n=1 Tax=Bradyrhizobium manausense TaxID=989370 RepID=UPI001BA93C68|nr:hypothetical protein [Bradyrhizobium manausense]MBR0684424.1 hypothetical protein [Bradyrhizobium manausense]